jgi:hypothetical protein
MKYVEIEITCGKCGSSVDLIADNMLKTANCKICGHSQELNLAKALVESGDLVSCPCCQRKDFYQQPDFNRKVGIFIFTLGAIITLYTFDETYGLPIILFWLLDVLLYKWVPTVVICYKCATNFRKLTNVASIPAFDHEMNDRIIYSNHDFDGKPIKHD